MSEHRHAHEIPYEPPHESVEFDREIQYHQLIWMGVALLVTAILSGVLVFFLLRGFVSWRAEQAGPPPVMPAPAAAAGAPQLLARPERELDRVRREEKDRLTTYGWIDPASGVAHIPIDKAIDLIAAQGLPSRPPVTATPTAAPTPMATVSTAPVQAASPAPTPEAPR